MRNIVLIHIITWKVWITYSMDLYDPANWDNPEFNHTICICLLQTVAEWRKITPIWLICYHSSPLIVSPKRWGICISFPTWWNGIWQHQLKSIKHCFSVLRLRRYKALKKFRIKYLYEDSIRQNEKYLVIWRLSL